MPPASAELPIHQANQEFDHEVRHATDTVTWMAEMLYGSMRTSFDFHYDSGVLRGEDGGSMDAVFDDAIEEAQVISYLNPSLLFELRRRLVEREELDNMKAMLVGELYTDEGEEANTIVVLSDFPPELMGATESVGGYNVDRKQAMLRVITKQPDGSLKVTSQSLDGSNRQALEAIGRALGKPPEEGELLSQRINLNFTAEGQEKLVDNLTEIYDDSLAEQRGGRWHAGIRQPDERAYVNTYEFACHQTDLIALFTRAKIADPKNAEKLRYKIAATATARYENYVSAYNRSDIHPGVHKPKDFVKIQAIGNAFRSLEQEITVYTRRAEMRGDTYSGCGMTISGGGSISEAIAARLGYGGGWSSSESGGTCIINSKECPQCKRKNVKTWVTRGADRVVHFEGACGCKA